MIQHVDATGPELRTVLTTAGVPAGQQSVIASAVRACLHDRVAEDDPDVRPASCAAAGSANDNPAISRYARTVVQDSFRDAAVWSLAVAFALLVVAFATAFLLPRQARPDPH